MIQSLDSVEMTEKTCNKFDTGRNERERERNDCASAPSIDFQRNGDATHTADTR